MCTQKATHHKGKSEYDGFCLELTLTSLNSCQCGEVIGNGWQSDTLVMSDVEGHWQANYSTWSDIRDQ